MSEYRGSSSPIRNQSIFHYSKQRMAMVAQIKKNCFDAINKMDTDQLFNVSSFRVLFRNCICI